jgi:AAA+ ATPase superfamily predicted ATPase
MKISQVWKLKEEQINIDILMISCLFSFFQEGKWDRKVYVRKTHVNEHKYT